MGLLLQFCRLVVRHFSLNPTLVHEQVPVVFWQHNTGGFNIPQVQNGGSHGMRMPSAVITQVNRQTLTKRNTLIAVLLVL